MSRVPVTTRAILLRSVDYRDSDRIVTLLSETLGVVAAIARGARKSKTRFAGALEPFCEVEAEFAFGAGELGTLHSAQVSRSYPSILASYENMEAAGRALSALRALLPPHQPEPRVFATATRLFEMLDRSSPSDAAHVLSFELRVLALTGLSPFLGACGRCGASADGRSALFDPARGSIVCRACGGGSILLSPSARDQMQLCATEQWENARWSASDSRSARAAVDALVQHHAARDSSAHSR